MLHSIWIFTVCKRTRLMVGLNDLMLSLYGGHPINSQTEFLPFKHHKCNHEVAQPVHMQRYIQKFDGK